MSPISIGFLVAFIVLIGAAFHFKVLKINIGKHLTQFSIRSQGATFRYCSQTWLFASIAILAAAGITASLHALSAHAPHLLVLILSGGSVFGLNTLNWLWPATGAAGPTAAQVANQDSVVVDVTTDGALMTQTFTHNLNISAADIANGWPDIIIEPNPASGIPATLLLVVTRPVTANAVILTFAAVVGTFRLKIKRPHTIGR